MNNKKRFNSRKHGIGEELSQYNETKLHENIKVEAKFSKPKNESQARYVRALNKTDNKIIIATGPAGTGKTLFGTELVSSCF